MTEKERRAALRIQKDALISMWAEAKLIRARALEMYNSNPILLADCDTAVTAAGNLIVALSDAIDELEAELKV